MKNIKLLLSAVLVVAFVIIGLPLFAQAVDGIIQPTPAQPQTFDAINYLVGLIPVKYQGITLVIVSTLLLWEQFLARTGWIKANSTEMMITGWIQKVVGILKPKA